MTRPKQKFDSQETSERLLDTAERLFGQYGYDGVGMRMLAEHAKVNLGAATYHFGTKQNLYIATFTRRFRVSNAERLRLLEAAGREAQGRPLNVETILDCLVRPGYQTGLAHPNFLALVARSILTPPPFLHAVLRRESEPNIAAFVTALQRSLPDIPREVIWLRTSLAMGSFLILSMQIARWPGTRSREVEENILKELVRFISAGTQSAVAVPHGPWMPMASHYKA
jgi:AcrR family transcriptional regulator